MASAYPNEVGPHTPQLQLRYFENPVAQWCGRFLEGNRRHPVPEFHLDLYDDYVAGGRAVIKAPRSFAKTTTVENYIVYLACEHSRLRRMPEPPVFPHRKVFAISETGPKAEEIMRHVKTELEENGNIVSEYGELRPPKTSKKKWTERLIQTRDGFELKVGGAGCQVRGFRPTLILLDDIENDKHVRSEDQRAFMEDWIDGPVLGMLDEIECQALLVGTTLHPLCALNYVERKPNWRTHVYTAYCDGIMEEGHELWPSKWPHERLQEKIAEVGMRKFQSEYMNNPIVSENPIFIREWFQSYKPDEIKTFDKTVVSIDPAISKKDRSSETAIVGMSTFKEEPRYYLRRGGVQKGHFGVERTVHEAVRIYDLIGASEILIETIAYQKALEEWLQRYLNDNHRAIPITCITPDQDKERRANEVQPMFQRTEVYFDFEDPLHQAVMDQLYLFPTGDRDDLVDGVVMDLGHLRKWRTGPKTATGPRFMDEGKEFVNEQRKVYG
jgi:predicted phage terminase large subunit-like protein